MGKHEEVQHFLTEFQVKLNQWGFRLRDDRGQNMLTLFELELSHNDCGEILSQLTVADFSEGPLEDTLHKELPMWVFGKNIKDREIYIKITPGRFGSEVVCISFHKAERKMNYPYRE